MKTRNLVWGAMIAAIGTLMLTRANAQEQPTIKILPGYDKDVIKVMYCGETNGSVIVRFTDAEGVIASDKINPKNFDKGFLKRYKVTREPGDFFWVEVSNEDVYVRYKVFSAASDEWTAQLEKTTYSYPAVASNKPHR